MSRRRLLALSTAALALPIARFAAAAGLDDRVARLSRPAIGMAAKAGGSGKSHFGGLPLVPKDFEWPRFAGQPLDFLLQVELGETAVFRSDLDLPSTGRLLFFYATTNQKWGFDPADRGCSHVVWFEKTDGHVAMSPPGRDPLPDLAIDFSQKISRPHPYSPRLDALQLSDAQKAALDESHFAPTFAQLGGLPFIVQDDLMELECEATSEGINVGRGFGTWIGRAKAPALRKKWQLLLQMPSLDELGIMWGDSGFLYFWIRRDDLARRDFSKAWLILQSY